MADKKTKLELTWIGKDQRPRLEPRILLHDAELSHTATARVSEEDIFDNVLVHGDNLLALRALEQQYTGKVRCVFIDPPYNTDNAFEGFYEDGIEHSVWLSLIRERLDVLWRLLTPDGSLWISIDDNECHYLKVVCDELFGRRQYVGSMVWEKDKGRRSDAAISTSHDYILVYAPDPVLWGSRRNLLGRTEDQNKRYRNPDGDPRGPWLQGDNGTAKSASEGSRWEVTLPSGRRVTPPPGRGWGFGRETYERALAENRMYFGADGNGMPILKRYLSEVQDGVVPRSWWTADEAGHNQEAKRDHLNKLLEGVEPFPTPKPERLLQRILQIATNPGDIVLDSFAGSGTTGAVAQKMGRRWIMVEVRPHCFTHLVPRLRKVIDAEDPYGITEAVGWKGGGGFRFYRLAPSLLEKDKWGNFVIADAYRKGPDAGAHLAEAMCKLEGFTYAPSADDFWIHGTSTERDYIYVTTQTLGPDQLRALSDEVGPERSLLICCGAHIGSADAFDNLTIKKIPTTLLSRCEWGRDDYSLNVSSVMAKPEPEPPPSDSPVRHKLTARRRVSANELPLFTALIAPEETK